MPNSLGISNISVTGVPLSETVDRHLARAICNLAIFLEFTRSNLLDDNASIGAMEDLASELALMAAESKRALCEAWEIISSEYDDLDIRNFVLDLPRSLGLVE